MAEFSAWLRERLNLTEPRPDARPTKIFVGRRDARIRRKVANEEEVRDRLRQRGFACVDAGEMPLKEKAQLFSDAELVVAPHGGGLTNLLFCRPGTRVIEIFSSAGARPLSPYRLTASHLGLPYYRMVVEPSGVPQPERSEKSQLLNANMAIDLDCLERRLEAMSLR
jgi:capsular polysaccharide biosynthesis protein